jgi:hypothetical protein
MLKYSNEYIFPSIRLVFDKEVSSANVYRKFNTNPSKSLRINTNYVYNEVKYHSDLDTAKLKAEIREATSSLSKEVEYLFLKRKIPAPSYSHITTYLLPSCLQKLEKMTCLEYLQSFSVKIPLRCQTIKVLFRKFRLLDEPTVSRIDLMKAIFDFHEGLLKQSEIEEFLRFLDIQKPDSQCEMSFNFGEFEAVFVFAERYFFQKCHANLLNNGPFVQELNQELTMLEKLDFRSLEIRLESLTLNPSLRNLLGYFFLSFIQAKE